MGTRFRAVHCLFEQSGTFRDVFRQLGYMSLDYDIRNDYGKTDIQIDLFAEIVDGYKGEKSVFDIMSDTDLILAFFPCTYFSANNMMIFSNTQANRDYTIPELITRNQLRATYYERLLQLFAICQRRQLPLIVENPYHLNYLVNNFPFAPAIVDTDRRVSGDIFPKRTMYYFLNITPKPFKSYQPTRTEKRVQHIAPGKRRSEITSTYAYNFVCDRILGLRHPHQIPTLFDK